MTAALVPFASVTLAADGTPVVLPVAAPPTTVSALAVWRRAAVVAWRVAPLVASFVRDHRRWLVRGAPVPRSAAFHTRRAAMLVDVLARLGPTFVKLAQLLAARADLVPEPYLSALGTLADQVPPVPLDAVRRTIVDEYGTMPEALFEEFDPTPIAAASLGQVHAARWQGREVVVKVLRPGVERLVAADVRVVGGILDRVQRRFPNPHLRGVVTATREFGVRIWEELDFRHEAANAVAMRANFAGRAGVAVPAVEPALVRRRALVLERMHGVRIDRAHALVAAGVFTADDLVRRVIELYMRMMLVDGFFHADPHPGNLLVRHDGTIVVLDFGMVVPVARELRRRLARTAFAGIRRDAEGIVDGFVALGIAPADGERAELRALVDALLDVAYAADTTTLDRLQLLADRVMHTLYRYPVTLPSDLVYFARTAALIEGLGARYDTHFNGVTFASPVALRLRHEIVRSLRNPGESDFAFLGVGVDELVQLAAGGQLGGVVGDAVSAVLGRAAGDAVATVVDGVVQAGRELASLVRGWR